MGPGRTRPRRAVSMPCGGLNQLRQQVPADAIATLIILYIDTALDRLVIGRTWLAWSGIGITADNHDRKWLTDLNAGRGIRAGNTPVCDWTFNIK